MVLDFSAFLYEIFKALWLAAIFQAQACVISALKLPSSKKLSSIESWKWSSLTKTSTWLDIETLQGLKEQQVNHFFFSIFFLKEKCFTQFSTRTYWNRSLTTSDLFPMFTQLGDSSNRQIMNGCSCQHFQRQNFSWFLS